MRGAERRLHPRNAADVSYNQRGGHFFTILLSAILAGWLIALMVWLLPAAESPRVSIIVMVTYLVGLGGFPHIVAGQRSFSTWLSLGMCLDGVFHQLSCSRAHRQHYRRGIAGHAQVVARNDD